MKLVIMGVYPPVNVYIARWKDPPCFMGKGPKVEWAMFNSYVELPEGIGI